MAGLNTCTRLRAMPARRRRRINSSLLPENIGPQIASIHPTGLVMMSMLMHLLKRFPTELQVQPERLDPERSAVAIIGRVPDALKVRAGPKSFPQASVVVAL